ncbi:MAG: hypothetical protein RL368_2434, partial [Pseudomonadota bacterium]
MDYSVPKFPLDELVEQLLNFFTENFAFLTKAISKLIESLMD